MSLPLLDHTNGHLQKICLWITRSPSTFCTGALVQLDVGGPSYYILASCYVRSFWPPTEQSDGRAKRVHHSQECWREDLEPISKRRLAVLDPLEVVTGPHSHPRRSSHSTTSHELQCARDRGVSRGTSRGQRRSLTTRRRNSLRASQICLSNLPAASRAAHAP